MSDEFPVRVEHDSIEKIIMAMSALNAHCKHEFKTTKVMFVLFLLFLFYSSFFSNHHNISATSSQPNSLQRIDHPRFSTYFNISCMCVLNHNLTSDFRSICLQHFVIGLVIKNEAYRTSAGHAMLVFTKFGPFFLKPLNLVIIWF